MYHGLKKKKTPTTIRYCEMSRETTRVSGYKSLTITVDEDNKSSRMKKKKEKSRMV